MTKTISCLNHKAHYQMERKRWPLRFKFKVHFTLPCSSKKKNQQTNKQTQHNKELPNRPKSWEIPWHSLVLVCEFYVNHLGSYQAFDWTTVRFGVCPTKSWIYRRFTRRNDQNYSGILGLTLRESCTFPSGTRSFSWSSINSVGWVV